MIEAKEAVRVAMESMRELFEESDIPHLALEEVERSPDGESWQVTVSYARPFAKTTIESMTGQQGKTTYKVLEIEAESGVVRSMKNRQI